MVVKIKGGLTLVGVKRKKDQVKYAIYEYISPGFYVRKNNEKNLKNYLKLIKDLRFKE